MANPFSTPLKQRYQKLRSHVPIDKFRDPRHNPLLFVAVFAVAGCVFLVATHAATTTASIEAEAGTLAGNAQTITDSSASGGAVRFGTSSTGGAGSPAATAAPSITDTTVANRFAYADVLTAGGDAWSVGGSARACGPSTGMVCAFQWQKSTDGSTWSNITTGDCLVLCQRTYRVQASDVGAKLRVIVTAGTAQGSTDAFSAATSANSTDLSCDYNVSSAATLNTDYQSASAGQTICLASGTYNWSPTVARAAGANVVVKPASGASVTMSFNPNNASNITLAGPLTLTTSTFNGTAKNITIYNASLASGNNEIVLVTDKFNNNNINIDNVSFVNQTGPTNDLTRGRVRTDFNTTDTQNNIGVTVSNSFFSQGAMIDILSEGGAGLTILNNEFTKVDNTVDESIHSDSIFDYGDGATSRMVIKHNWFHDMIAVPGCGWTQWDGGTSNTFEDNVVSHVGGPTGSDGCYESMAAMGDVNSVINHNVFEPGKGIDNTTLGQVLLGFKTDEGGGTGTAIRDNTMNDIENGDGGGNSKFTQDHNLCKLGCSGTAGDQGPGTGNLTGSPTWAGGTGPTSFTGFALAANSTGVGKASDGTNMGIELPTGYQYPR